MSIKPLTDHFTVGAQNGFLQPDNVCVEPGFSNHGSFHLARKLYVRQITGISYAKGWLGEPAHPKGI
jgi:hypothetical protein